MFDHLFENRNSTVTNLLKLGDCLGRSLRENIEIFSIDSETKKVAFLAEDGKVISGEYSFTDGITFTNIRVQESAIFQDNEIFDAHVQEKVTDFVGGLNSDDYGGADDSFTDILDLWENRLKFENVKTRLEEKCSVFSDSQTIVDTEQFQRFLEMMPQITEFLEEHRETIQEVQEIENAIKLSNSVSQAFDFPRITYAVLEENPEYRISKGLNKSVYELICKQELVKKELLESKNNFEDVWATNAKIRNLATLVFEDDDEIVLENLVEAIVEVPFLALTTKRQLVESISNAFSLSDSNAITPKDIKTFVARLFEMKKPIKQIIINLLNEKYGINVQNLKSAATFSSLAETQVVIFESLTRLAPKGSVVKDTLSELSKMLKNKNGVEVIDVNDIIQECFEHCGYEKFTEDFRLIENLSFETILDEDITVTELLEKAKEKLLMDKAKKKADKEGLSPEQAKDKKASEKDEGEDGDDEDFEDDSIRASEAASPMSNPSPMSKGAPFSPDAEGDEEEEEKPVKEEAEVETTEEPEPEAEEKVEPVSQEEFLDTLKDMEDLLQGMSTDNDDDEDEDDEEDASQPDDTEV